MGDSVDPDDLPARALRQGRAAVPDAGFSRRVAALARAQRRRSRWFRLLPVAMAALGLALAAAGSGWAVGPLGEELAQLLAGLGEASQVSWPVLEILPRHGIPLWMVPVSLGALLSALFLPERGLSP